MTQAIPITLNINGTDRRLKVEPRVTLLDALREHLGLTGTKKGCDQGAVRCLHRACRRQAGAGLPDAGGAGRGPGGHHHRGLSPPGGPLHPVQAAFLDSDAFQCGYCTPGADHVGGRLHRRGPCRIR